jgi:hypothetical protein
MPQARAVPTERMLGKPEARRYGRFIGCPAVADALPLLVDIARHLARHRVRVEVRRLSRVAAVQDGWWPRPSIWRREGREAAVRGDLAE